MVRLTSQTAFPITKENLQKVLKAYFPDDFTFSRATTGIVNTTCFITTGKKQYVLRIYQYGRKSKEDIEEEIAFQDFLRNNGIPVPHVLQTLRKKQVSEIVVAGRKWQVILMERMPGKVNGVYSEQIVHELAMLQAKMHFLGIEYAGKSGFVKRLDMLHNGYAQKVLQMVGHDAIKETFLQEVHQFDVHFPKNLPYGFNHLDIDLGGNVLVDNDHVTAILDFDDIILSPLVICLGNTLWHILSETGSWEKVRQYISFYETTRTLSQDEKHMLPDVMKFRNFTLGCLYLELGKDGDEFQKILQLQQDIDVHATSVLQ